MSENQLPDITNIGTAGKSDDDTFDDGKQQTFSAEYVRQLRDEAARYRTERNSAVSEAKDALNKEWEVKVGQVNSQLADVEAKLVGSHLHSVRLQTALELNVPSDKVVAFAEILKGSTEDEIKASAVSAKELFGGLSAETQPQPATDPTQGSGLGGNIPLNGDPILAAIKKAVGV